MNIILLSGGSGKRLWPLSNDVRSKQFLRVLKSPTGDMESMLQRMTRQIAASQLDANITIATSESQYDSILNQLEYSVDVVTEPERRDTFPAIALSASYLIKERGCDMDEVVVVMPSDSYVDSSYFEAIAKMVECVESCDVDMALMGINPTEPSTKFGYIVPRKGSASDDFVAVDHFTEKPNTERAKELISQGAVWNGGVFAFRLRYIAQIIDRYIQADTFAEIRSRYSEFRKISFDYEVVEKASSIALVSYGGEWRDLGTWNSLIERVEDNIIGDVVSGEGCENNHIINELDIPVVCLGVKDLVVAASPDGVLVSTKKASVNLKSYADELKERPMYEERRWGSYRVMGHEHFSDGHNALTKLLCVKAGKDISYQYHNHRDEIWTFIDGECDIVVDGVCRRAGRGDVVHIKAGQKHSLCALTDSQIIEVQSGRELTESDIIRVDLT